ncbi:MAG TPA: polyprenyl diphosphate synthase [Steroidobacteraceae bacterium]|nr:polyprenyl diphosphate synthase [Steroidobacteraceae bacterium]
MHLAIIMDGNGRWASRRGLPRPAGHAQGARALRGIVEAAAASSVDTLTVYAFSCDNWGRPRSEVAALLALLRRYLGSEAAHCRAHNVRVNVIGRRDRLGDTLLRAIEECERLTQHCTGMHLRVAVDYSARHSILAAARLGPATDAQFLERVNSASHSAPAPAVDLLIRTGGEKRLSDFLLWECAYAELYFTDCLWPDFDAAALGRALQDYCGRQRRFGRLDLPAPAAAGTAQEPLIRAGHGT